MSRAAKPRLIAAIVTICLMLLHGGGSTGARALPEHREPDQQWHAFGEAQKMAKSSGRLLLVRFNADWCVYCKEMERTVFPDPEIRQIISRYFIPAQVDIESSRLTFLGDTELTEEDLAERFGVSTLPATGFVRADGQPILIQPGFLDAEALKPLLTFIGERAYERVSFKEYLARYDG